MSGAEIVLGGLLVAAVVGAVGLQSAHEDELTKKNKRIAELEESREKQQRDIEELEESCAKQRLDMNTLTLMDFVDSGVASTTTWDAAIKRNNQLRRAADVTLDEYDTILQEEHDISLSQFYRGRKRSRETDDDDVDSECEGAKRGASRARAA